VIGLATSTGRTALRMAAALAVAILAGYLVARVDLQPSSVLVPGAAVLVVAALFLYQPAEGLGVFLLFSLVANTLQVVLPADLRYFDEVGLLVLGACMLVRYRPPLSRLRIGVAEWALVAVVTTGVASSLVAGVPADVWVPGLLLLLKGVAFFYLVSWLPLRQEQVLRVGGVILGAAIIILALGAWEVITPAGFRHTLGLPPYSEQRGGLTVVTSVFLHPALFGWVTVFASLFVYAWVLLRRAWWLVPLGLAFNVGTFFSGRRTPILGLVLALGVALVWYAWQSRSTHAVLRTWLPLAGAVGLLLAAFVPAVGGFYADTAGQYLDAPHAIVEILGPHPNPAQVAQVQPRTALYVGSVAVARDHFPFGGGLGRWGSFMSRLDYSPLYAEYGLNRIWGLSPTNRIAIDDTFWPSVLGETGVFGLIAFALFIGTVFVRLWRASGLPGSPGWQLLALGGLLVFVQGFVASLTAGTYVAAPIAYFVFGAAGAVLAAVATEEETTV
jgi:hypothetical protein